MKKTISVFALGVVVGYGISLLKSDRPIAAPQVAIPKPYEAKIVKANPPGYQNQPLVSEKPPASEIPPIDVQPQRELAANSPHEAEDSPDVFNLDIAESELTMMEENLSDLQRDVSLIRSEEGWIVRFYNSSNLMESIGVKDHDLIRFSHLEALKRDPTKTYMVSRLESLFSHLER